VLAYRPDYQRGWTARPEHARIDLGALTESGGTEMVRAVLNRTHASRVSLTPLPATQSTAMVQALLGSERVPAEIERLIATKTDGNPLFIASISW
jgi:predicted ATPase